MVNLYAVRLNVGSAVLGDRSIQKRLIVRRAVFHPGAGQELNRQRGFKRARWANLEVGYDRVGNTGVIECAEKDGIIRSTKRPGTKRTEQIVGCFRKVFIYIRLKSDRIHQAAERADASMLHPNPIMISAPQ